MLKRFLADRSIKNQLLKTIYLLIHERGPISKAELLELTNAKPTTLNRMMDELLQNKYIVEGGIGQSSGGRRPVLYEVNRYASYIVGIDISRTKTKVVLVDLKFDQLENVSFEMTEQDEPDIVLSKITAIIQKWLNTYAISMDTLLGIGVGAVGPVQRETGMIVKPEGFLAPNWVNVPVVYYLESKFPVTVLIDNGANSAAIAEYTLQQKLYNNILYVIGGYGIRCGFVSDGKLLHSREGDATAFGHIIIKSGDRQCVCGKQGCLTAYASYGAIFQDLLEQTGRSYSISEIVQALEQGDPAVERIVAQSAYYYGIGIANLVNILHPELVVLHGTLPFQSPLYFNKVVESTRLHMFNKEKDKVRFHQGLLKDDAIAVGAATQVLHSYIS